MDIGFTIGFLLLGCTLGYLYYLWGNKQDAKKWSQLEQDRASWDWYQVKLRLPYMHVEAGRGIIIVEVKARDEAHAQEEAKKVLKGRSMTRCTWVSVDKL